MNSEFSPNVHQASQPEEEKQLEEDYQQAVKDALANGKGEVRLKFENMVKENSCAMVSLETKILEKLMAGEPFKNYHEKPNFSVVEKESWERIRKAVDILLFGEAHGKEIRYGCLSLDGLGLTGYGNCHCYICFGDEMSKRASVYKTNAFVELREGKFNPSRLGYRASWLQRHKLAVAKSVVHLQTATLKDFPMILCHDTGSKEDDCIEVHIYGQFDLKAVEAIKLTRTKVAPKNTPEEVKMEDTHLETIAEKLMGEEIQKLIGKQIPCQII